MYVSNIQNSFSGKRKVTQRKASPYIKRDIYQNGNDKISRTRYFSKDGKLVGFKLQHSNGVIDYAREGKNPKYPNKVIIVTKSYNFSDPIDAKLLIGEDFYDGIKLNQNKWHNPSINEAIKELENRGLLKKKKEKK